MCSPVCSSTVIGCTYDISTGIYNMYVYDIEEDTLSDDWAISSTNITFTYQSAYNKLRKTDFVEIIFYIVLILIFLLIVLHALN